MKTTGIIFLVLAACHLIAMLIGAISEAPYNSIMRLLSNALIFGALGAYLVHKANKKKTDENNKKKWEDEN